MIQRGSWLILSVLLNAFGNALTIKAALGSAPWTAASLNLSNMFGMTVGEMLIIMGSVVLLGDDLLRRHWNGMRDVYNFLYVLSFGSVVDLWLKIMTPLNLDLLPFQAMACVTGILCIGAALSIYFRVNLVLHPFDDLLKILREKYVHGNVVIAQYISLGIPLSLGLMIGLVRGHLLGISFGTVVSFLCTGYFILLFDKLIHLHFENSKGRHAPWRVLHAKHFKA
ncbi:MAG: DUF6198 family protein [Sporolactobacillus sp.]